MEEILEGERIREYRIEALAGPTTWTVIGRGQSVGHKRIHRYPTVEAAKIRLTVLEATAKPRVRALAVFARV